MWVYLKLAVVPTFGAWELLAVTVPSAGTLAGLVAVAIIVGGAMMMGALRADNASKKNLIETLQAEATVYREKADRLEKENVVLRAQPDLSQHHKLLQKLLDRADAQIERGDTQIELLREIKTATVPPPS